MENHASSVCSARTRGGLRRYLLSHLAWRADAAAFRIAAAHQPYRGLKIPKVADWHKNLAELYGTLLWLWLFWRAKNDGKALLVSRGVDEAPGSALHPEWQRVSRPAPRPLLSHPVPMCGTQGLEHPWDHGHGHDDHDDHGDHEDDDDHGH